MKDLIPLCHLRDDRDPRDLLDHLHIILFHHAALPVVQDDAPDRNISMGDIFARRYHMIDRPQPRIRDNKHRQNAARK